MGPALRSRRRCQSSSVSGDATPHATKWKNINEKVADISIEPELQNRAKISTPYVSKNRWKNGKENVSDISKEPVSHSRVKMSTPYVSGTRLMNSNEKGADISKEPITQSRAKMLKPHVLKTRLKNGKENVADILKEPLSQNKAKRSTTHVLKFRLTNDKDKVAEILKEPISQKRAKMLKPHVLKTRLKNGKENVADIPKDPLSQNKAKRSTTQVLKSRLTNDKDKVAEILKEPISQKRAKMLKPHVLKTRRKNGKENVADISKEPLTQNRAKISVTRVLKTRLSNDNDKVAEIVKEPISQKRAKISTRHVMKMRLMNGSENVADISQEPTSQNTPTILTPHVSNTSWKNGKENVAVISKEPVSQKDGRISSVKFEQVLNDTTNCLIDEQITAASASETAVSKMKDVDRFVTYSHPTINCVGKTGENNLATNVHLPVYKQELANSFERTTKMTPYKRLALYEFKVDENEQPRNKFRRKGKGGGAKKKKKKMCVKYQDENIPPRTMVVRNCRRKPVINNRIFLDDSLDNTCKVRDKIEEFDTSCVSNRNYTKNIIQTNQYNKILEAVKNTPLTNSNQILSTKCLNSSVTPVSANIINGTQSKWSKKSSEHNTWRNEIIVQADVHREPQCLPGGHFFDASPVVSSDKCINDSNISIYENILALRFSVGNPNTTSSVMASTPIKEYTRPDVAIPNVSQDSLNTTHHSAAIDLECHRNSFGFVDRESCDQSSVFAEPSDQNNDTDKLFGFDEVEVFEPHETRHPVINKNKKPIQGKADSERMPIQEVLRLLENEAAKQHESSSNTSSNVPSNLSNSVSCSSSLAPHVNSSEESNSYVLVKEDTALAVSFKAPPRRSYTHAHNPRKYVDDSESSDVEDDKPMKMNAVAKKKHGISKKEMLEMERLAAELNTQLNQVDQFDLCVE